MPKQANCNLVPSLPSSAEMFLIHADEYNQWFCLVNTYLCGCYASVNKISRVYQCILKDSGNVIKDTCKQLLRWN